MNIETFVLGPLENSAYVVGDNTAKCIIIDAPAGSEQIAAFIKKKKLQPEAVLLTHAHFDHINGLAAIRAACKAPVYIHKSEREYLVDPALNGSTFFGFPSNNVPADATFDDGNLLQLAGLSIKVLHTPGHTVGGCCFLIGDNLFSGDTLFQGSVGRTDLPAGSMKQLLASIRDKLLQLPARTRVLPGHGPETTIEAEKNANPYLYKYR